MGSPHTTAKNRVHGARSQIISAMSCLNMPASPITPNPGSVYLSQTDEMAKHAMEHLQAAFDYLADVSTYPTGDFSKSLADKIAKELITWNVIAENEKDRVAPVIRFLLEDINR